MKDVPVETAGGPTTQPAPQSTVADAAANRVVLVTDRKSVV